MVGFIIHESLKYPTEEDKTCLDRIRNNQNIAQFMEKSVIRSHVDIYELNKNGKIGFEQTRVFTI